MLRNSRNDGEITKTIHKNIEKNYQQLMETFENCFDIVKRRLTNIEGRKVIVTFSDGLVTKDSIAENVIRPFLGFSFDKEGFSPRNLEDLKEKLLTAVDIKPEADFQKAVTKCLSGDTVVFVDGYDQALIIQTRGWPNRGIPKPYTQQAVRGPKEGFTETLLFNVALLRRKIRSPKLKTEILQKGNLTQTDICMVYLEGAVQEELVEKVRKRLQDIDVEYILESGHIEQLIEDNPRTVFSTIGNNEKPDIVAAKLIKGRVAVIVDGTPFVLTIPMLFTETFQVVEDYYTRPYYANFLRILRVIAYILTIMLPGIYVALVTYHQEMIPDQLLETLIRASEGVPMQPAVEMFIMLLLYELLRESLLRLPASLGSTVGIVGVLIIGEAAVGANLIGAPSVVIAAMTFITSAVVNSAIDSIAILRILLLVLAAAFGVYGILIGLFMILAHLCTLRSFGYPYMLPLAPIRWKGLKDSVIRTSSKQILKRKGLL